jgi:hypothetical protein
MVPQKSGAIAYGEGGCRRLLHKHRAVNHSELDGSEQIFLQPQRPKQGIILGIERSAALSRSVQRERG